MGIFHFKDGCAIYLVSIWLNIGGNLLFHASSYAHIFNSLVFLQHFIDFIMKWMCTDFNVV